MNNYFLKLLSIMLATAAVAGEASAEVRLPRFVTDSMVVQQRSQWTVQGRATGSEVKIEASWLKNAQTVAVDADGRFSAELETPQAGGPYTITFDDGGQPTTLRDIYSGEVWLCSGQSNMEMPVGGWGKVNNYEQEIANAHYPAVRFLQIAKQTAFEPQSDTEVTMGGWRTCTPATVENFSSIAYFFAREISQKQGVPVGVIDCTWGGTPAEAWTSMDGVKAVPGFEEELAMIANNNLNRDKIKARYEANLEKWMQMALSDDAAVADGYTGTMPVPGEWEKSALPEFNGIVNLQRTVSLPASWAGKPVELHLAMIDDEDVTSFNGQKIAQGYGYNSLRVYTIPAELVKGGEAVIDVRVTDYEGGGGIWGDAADLYMRQGDETISLAGEWAYRVLADFSLLPKKPVSPESSSYPTVLYNAMLYPLHTLPVKGVLWYQGCANVGRDEQYSPLFKQLIADWRTLWNDSSLPFYFVQLAGYLQPQMVQPDSQWAALRQAQADALALDNTAMAVAIDIGNPDDIHPKNKQEVARRLALIALNRSYGHHQVVYQAPELKKCKIKGNKAELTFDGEIFPCGGGDVVTGIIALAGGNWQQATAQKTGKNRITVTASGVIEEIKYNWADYPDGNLRGETGLPVAPFKTK